MAPPLIPIEQRFWAKVRKTESCWIWTGCKWGEYGQLLGTGGRSGKRFSAHRLSWEVHNGPIPEGLWVLHHCDVPLCVNPEHLFLGTPSTNSVDRDNKRRRDRRPGEAHHNVKLTEAMVQDIRSRQGQTQKRIAEEFGVSFQQISRICSGQQWTHLNGASICIPA